tara:strand:+ start:1003 stop:1320 length:318 start_codon:yes stop_codon:yes gene_type:complete
MASLYPSDIRAKSKPKKEVKFKVYKLICEKGYEYYGTTIRQLRQRRNDHKRSLGTSRSCTSRKLFEKNKSVHIELIRMFNSKKRALKFEKYCIKNFSCVNKSMPI